MTPKHVPGITSNYSKILEKAGIWSVGVLRERLKEDFWTRGIYGIGDTSELRIVSAMMQAGLIDSEFEAYKEAYDRDYRRQKYIRRRLNTWEEQGE